VAPSQNRVNRVNHASNNTSAPGNLKSVTNQVSSSAAAVVAAAAASLPPPPPPPPLVPSSLAKKKLKNNTNLQSWYIKRLPNLIDAEASEICVGGLIKNNSDQTTDQLMDWHSSRIVKRVSKTVIVAHNGQHYTLIGQLNAEEQQKHVDVQNGTPTRNTGNPPRTTRDHLLNHPRNARRRAPQNVQDMECGHLIQPVLSTPKKRPEHDPESMLRPQQSDTVVVGDVVEVEKVVEVEEVV